MKIGDKIRLLREKQGVSQIALAKLINYSNSFLCKIENNIKEPSKEVLLLIKQNLDIEHVPVTEKEILEFRKELSDWCKLIRNDQIDEAMSLQAQIKRAAELSLDSDLQILYSLFAFRLQHKSGRTAEGKGLLDALAEREHEFTKEHYYHYYYALGAYYLYMNESKLSLNYYIKAEALGEELGLGEETLYYNIAISLTGLDYAPKAILYITKAYEKSKSKFEKTFDLYFDIILALNYNKIGENEKAINLLINCLHRAKINGNKFQLEMVNHNLGCVYLTLKNYDKASAYFDTSIKHSEYGSEYYASNLLHKAYLLVQKEQIEEAHKIITTGLEISTNFEDMTVLFESLRHSLNLNDAASLTYIESTTIPRLSKNGNYLKAIEYCELLKNHFASKHMYKKALLYSGFANKFYKIIMKGDLRL